MKWVNSKALFTVTDQSHRQTLLGGENNPAAAVSPGNAQTALDGLWSDLVLVEVIPILELIFLHILLVDVIDLFFPP